MKNLTHAQMMQICKASRKQLKSQVKRLETLKNG
jgi:hypothetical protein